MALSYKGFLSKIMNNQFLIWNVIKLTSLRNIDICTQLILVEQCNLVTFERRPRLEKVTCPKFLSGRVPRNECTILWSYPIYLT